MDDCVAFTVCSNNYLPQAFTLGQSLTKENIVLRFLIILVDKKKHELNYGEFNFEIIEIQEIEPEIQTLAEKYNIIELSTCVKPKVFQYLFKKFEDIKHFFYFDPDIYVYSSIGMIREELGNKEIILTPHILNPIQIDNIQPNENLFLKFGIYNLGFIAVKKSENVNRFLEWWLGHTYHTGAINLSLGQFVDQLPINLVPIFFDNVAILKDPGLNVAPWNLHERSLSFRDDTYYINERHPLIFLHFSNFKPTKDLKITSMDWYQRVSLSLNKTLEKIYLEYRTTLLKNEYESYSKYVPYYNSFTKIKRVSIITRIWNKVKSF